MLSVHMDKIIFTPPRDLSLHYRALKPQSARWAPVAWLRRKKGFWQFWQLGNVLVKSCKYEDTGPSCSSTPVMIDRFCGSLRHHTRVSLLFHCSCRIVSNNDQELMLVIGVVKKNSVLPYMTGRMWTVLVRDHNVKKVLRAIALSLTHTQRHPVIQVRQGCLWLVNRKLMSRAE